MLQKYMNAVKETDITAEIEVAQKRLSFSNKIADDTKVKGLYRKVDKLSCIVPKRSTPDHPFLSMLVENHKICHS